MKKTLFEHWNGRQMHASGSWKTTKAEQMLIHSVGIFFVVSVIAVLVSPLIQINWFLIAYIVCCVLAFVMMFLVLFGIVFKKSKSQTFEKRYYDVDFTYNGITGKTENKFMEISKEEFLSGQEREKKIEQ